ncbi:MAG: hypothetical protein KKB20_19550 [Proteobacteria bacterium]|nr:hypothetical protein [Pseudomonadota bacterium]
MTDPPGPEPPRIEPSMSVLDVVSRYRSTEAVFKRYDEQAGECICCQALFERLDAVAEKYGLNPEKLIEDLQEAAIESNGAGAA